MVVPHTNRGSYGPEHEGKETARLEEDRTRDKAPLHLNCPMLTLSSTGKVSFLRPLPTRSCMTFSDGLLTMGRMGSLLV